MNEAILLLLIKILGIVLILLWGSIAVSMIYRRVASARMKRIEETFADLVSSYLFHDPDNPVSFKEINIRLRQVGIRSGRSQNIQFLIRLLIRTQQNIIGSKLEKLNILYTQIPPYGVSVNKINSWHWYRKARGIREIYEMKQNQHFEKVFRYRNHRNIYVRREAQIALVVFKGWESLRFLPYLERNITLWQQIKIVEKLYDNYPTPELKWLHRAYRTDKIFGKRLLMRIIRKFELHSEVNFILEHLNHEDYEVRETAIYCIESFVVSSSGIDYIKSIFTQIPDPTQQVQLLNYLFENSEIDVDFYLEQLYGPNDDLKLSVAEILWNNGYKEKVQEFYFQQYPKASLNVG